MPTEYERNLAAKRKEEEYQRQALAFQLSNRAPMGQVNPYIQAYQMTQGRGGGGGGGRGGPGMSALDGGFPGSSGLLKEKQQSDMYKELQGRYKTESEAKVNALNYRGSRGAGSEAKAQKDIYSQLERSAKLAKEVMDGKPEGPERLSAERTYTQIINRMAEMNQTPQQPMPEPPKRPDSEWLKFGASDPQNRYDKIWGNYKAGGNASVDKGGWNKDQMDAYDWLQQNPNDPRAAAVKKALGVK